MKTQFSILYLLFSFNKDGLLLNSYSPTGQTRRTRDTKIVLFFNTKTITLFLFQLIARGRTQCFMCIMGKSPYLAEQLLSSEHNLVTSEFSITNNPGSTHWFPGLINMNNVNRYHFRERPGMLSGNCLSNRLATKNVRQK